MSRYAAGTEVSSDRSRSEIERTLRRYGASAFAYAWEGAVAQIAFKLADRQIRFRLPLPDPGSAEFTLTPAKRTRRSPEAAEAAYEQAVRQRWRALSLVIKAKLEAVESGISTVEARPAACPGVRPGELPRVFRTGSLRLIQAASCLFRYSSMTSCGVL